MDRIVIAIDGPAGAGKSTISKSIAGRLNIEYIDTGAMYRAVALKIVKNNISLSDINAVKRLLDNTDINFIEGKIYLDGKDVSKEIRTPEISARASEVSALGVVRQKLVELQRKMALSKSVIMDGRDIGTNVLKDADFKIYLTASVEERAMRRYRELKCKDVDVTFQSICSDIEKRDKSDMEREINPLCKAEDAILIDTTSKDIDTVVSEILQLIYKGGN